MQFPSAFGSFFCFKEECGQRARSFTGEGTAEINTRGTFTAPNPGLAPPGAADLCKNGTKNPGGVVVTAPQRGFYSSFAGFAPPPCGFLVMWR